MLPLLEFNKRSMRMHGSDQPSNGDERPKKRPYSWRGEYLKIKGKQESTEKEEAVMKDQRKGQHTAVKEENT